MSRILNTSLLILLTTQNILAFDINKLDVPENFQVEIFVDNIEAPRQMAEGDDGYIFVGSKKGLVYIMRDHDNNGKIDDVEIIAKDLNDSSGVAYHAGSLFIAEINKVWRIDNIEKQLADFNDNVLEKPLVTEDLPSDAWHGRKWIMVDQDGSILLNVGAPCNVCLKEDERYATILRYRDNSWVIEARGVRNTVGFDIHPTNNHLYFTDNGRDWLETRFRHVNLTSLKSQETFLAFRIYMLRMLSIRNLVNMTTVMKLKNLY